MFSKDFYPTPRRLANKMIAKIKGDPQYILDPSAGKGDLIEALAARWSIYHERKISAIEISEELQATLRGKGIKVIDSDFLEFSGPDKFDLIIANPPFADGDRHLLKAIDIMYRGEIVFLLNAETIRNPFTNTRADLIKKLDALNADIEYVPDAFKDAERPTGVGVALIYIKIERQIEDDLFQGVTDGPETIKVETDRHHDISTGRTIDELVAEYNQIISFCTDTLLAYFKNYPKVWKYIGLNREADKHERDHKDLTERVQHRVNDTIAAVRTDFWRRTLNLKEVRSRLTSKKQAEFEDQIKTRCHMDFTTSNIRQFVLNLLGSHEKTITDSVLEIFEMFTKKYCWSDGLYDDNVHYFNGWKTNKAFKIGKKVIIPIYSSYGHPFVDYSGRWKLDYKAAENLRDIDTVFNYFDGMAPYLSMHQAIEQAFAAGKSSGIQSEYFKITVYKKRTIHLTFKNQDILRRFNIVACRGRGWLPHDYSSKPYQDCSAEEKAVIESFEGYESYIFNSGKPILPERGKLLALPA
jgi:Domain of unknown function (DUF4942)/Methyltransferase small domain